MSYGVFISYNHDDKKIADTLFEALTSLSAELKVFIDHSGLEGGDDYEDKISRSIRESQWFIIVCSGTDRFEKDMAWCFYEAGQFRAKLQAADQVHAIRDRICFIYDEEKPSQLRRYQGYKVTYVDQDRTPLSFRVENDDSLSYERTSLFSLIETILRRSAAEPLRDLNDAAVRKLMRGGVRKLTLAFAENTIDKVVNEEVFQPRINFLVSPLETQGVKSAMSVLGEFNALPNIFSIAGSSTTWGEIKAKAVTSNGGNAVPMWVTDLERAISEVAAGGIPQQTDFLCIGNDRRFYRPIVGRYELFKSGMKRCYVIFIPSRERRFNVSQRSSLLLSALILSIRFRQRVLPLVNDLGKETNPDKKKAEILQRLISEITLVESESAEFGLEAPKDEHDDPVLLNAFHADEDKEFIRNEMTEWSKSRNVVFNIIAEAQSPSKETSWAQAANTALKVFENLRKVNGLFIDRLTLELRYAEKL
ncbi:toll/interleukin-1 receptor domain-containing protein [Lichenibacterium dinghuense]|uniref:toll/interleukin-1 receptor domain-containing protein n=1 Tax=Lichenibacterium dinghuense TaxID=2895977 RepID=UPI001F2012CD|nr:toll/interleukin-1 receptor domain-containing protein [Lichenibacterium sp. 6Y81]